MVVEEECVAVWNTMYAHATDAFSIIVLINVVRMHCLEGNAINMLVTVACWVFAISTLIVNIAIVMHAPGVRCGVAALRHALCHKQRVRAWRVAHVPCPPRRCIRVCRDHRILLHPPQASHPITQCSQDLHHILIISFNLLWRVWFQVKWKHNAIGVSKNSCHLFVPVCVDVLIFSVSEFSHLKP